MRKKELNFVACSLGMLFLIVGCGFVDRNTFQSIHVQFGNADFFYHIYQNRPDTELEQMLVLRGVDSLPAEISLTVDGAGTLILNDAKLEDVKNWAEKTSGSDNYFKPGEGGGISCNLRAVTFSFDPDGRVKKVHFDTKFNPMQVKIKSDHGEAMWPCSRSELKRVMGEPDKEVVDEGRIAPNH